MFFKNLGNISEMYSSRESSYFLVSGRRNGEFNFAELFGPSGMQVAMCVQTPDSGSAHWIDYF